MKFTDEKQTPNPPVEPTDRAFLLRCWREAGAGPGGRVAWRFCLVEPGNSETKRGFADLEALLAYLQRELKAG